MTSLTEVFEFLDVAEAKHFMNQNTVQARRTACNKLFEVLDEEQRTVEYVRDNIDVIKGRFTNKYKDVSGTTVDEYVRRAKLVLDNFSEWSADRAGWEKRITSKAANRTQRDEGSKARADRPQINSKSTFAGTAANSADDDGQSHKATFPFPGGRKVTVSLPAEGLTMSELKRLGYFLLPYASDWDPDAMPMRAPEPSGRVEDHSDRL
jgi:hypothetical protein